MIVAAFIVLLIAILAVLAAIFGGHAPASLDLGPIGHFNSDTTAMFFLGMATLLVLVLGLAMLRVGLRRARRRHRDRRRLGELSTKLDKYERHTPEERTSVDDGRGAGNSAGNHANEGSSRSGEPGGPGNHPAEPAANEGGPGGRSGSDPSGR